jgi:thiol:disulfide interchange protein DsbD
MSDSNRLHRFARVLIAALTLISAAAFAEQGPVKRDHVVVELITADKTVLPGSMVFAGLRMKHDAEWHTYWRNPGDSGLPTKLTWTLPEGVTASDIEWPAPHRIDIGELVNFGYEGELVLPVKLEIPATAKVGEKLPLAVKASWLICREECIPGEASLDASVTVGKAADPDNRWTALFDAARAAQPLRSTWETKWAESGENIDIVVDDLGRLKDVKSINFIPASGTFVAYAKTTIERMQNGKLHIRAPRSDSYEKPDGDVALLLADGDHHVYEVMASEGAVDLAPSVTPATETAPISAPQSHLSALIALLFAFGGGILLNLMPCVLPVLSLKALGLAEHAHDRKRAREHGLLYMCGALVCFLALASVLLALRAGGEALGWGFQLQTPWVVASLAMLMIVMGLSMSGMFELGTSWMGFGQQLTEGTSPRSAFFSGALAAIVASPCTAPFMGPALGFAITQPAPIALGVFAALALGLSLPIVLLSFAPGLGRWLPKPGAWMERFKQFLAYPLYATAVWLLWVLGNQTGADGMALAMLGAIALVFGIWLWNLTTKSWIARVVAVAAMVAAVATLFSLDRFSVAEASAASESAGSENTRAWEPWTQQKLDALRAKGEPVLVNMTASWCITCLANERVTLSSDTVKNRLRSAGVAYLKGDWTHRDAEITAYLAQFGRNGVPLYVLYPRGTGAPEVLPQILTPNIVDEALQRATSASASVAANR